MTPNSLFEIINAGIQAGLNTIRVLLENADDLDEEDIEDMPANAAVFPTAASVLDSFLPEVSTPPPPIPPAPDPPDPPDPEPPPPPQPDNVMTLDQFIASMRNNGNVRAFPGAEGFGAWETKGGRGGRSIKVTNSNRAGPGSFAAAMFATFRPKNIIFESGLIAETYKDPVSNRRTGNIDNGRVTIAGQTAPGGGVTLMKQLSEGNDVISVVGTEDVIIRHVRSRCGPRVGGLAGSDALSILNSRRVIADHISTSWATDGNIDVLGSSDVIVQYCILAEALSHSSHPKGEHSTGGIAGGSLGDPPGQTLSEHHNVLAMNGSRNYRCKGGVVDLVNNIGYTRSGGSARSPYGSVYINMVGCMLIRAPFSNNNYYLMKTGRGNAPIGTDSIAYFDGNIVPPAPPEGTVPTPYTGLNRPGEPISEVRFDAPEVRTTSASQAYKELVIEGKVGAYLTPDPHDQRILEHIKNRTGEIIDDPSEVGGFLESVPAGEVDLDSNGDGMPDWFIEGVANLYGAPLSINGLPDQVMTPIANTPEGLTWLEFYFALKAENKVLPPIM